MNFPEPEHRWHQFSLRSMLLFCTLVAILCSIGVSTHWSVATDLAGSLLIGAVRGGMVRGTRAGIISGAVYGIPGFIFTVVFITVIMFPASGFWRHDTWETVCRIAVLIGGVVGGVSGGVAARGR